MLPTQISARQPRKPFIFATQNVSIWSHASTQSCLLKGISDDDDPHMQMLREEKEAAEVQLFKEHTLKQRELRRKLEEEVEKEELVLQGKLAEGLRNIHKSFAERERQSELQLTQRSLPSPTQGSLDDPFHCMWCSKSESLSRTVLTITTYFMDFLSQALQPRTCHLLL